MPTPCATEVEKDLDTFLAKHLAPRSTKGGSHGPNLTTYVKLVARVPTSTAEDDGNNQSPSPGATVRPSLSALVRRVPTPTTQDASNNGAPSQLDRNTKPLNAEVGGPLNPEWVEWLMGWPIGWTDCTASATARFRPWCASHGISSAPERKAEPS